MGFFINLLGEHRPLAETWNGTSWTVRSVPKLGGVPFGHLHGVSCASATACTAVGATGFSDFPSRPLAEAWNGTSWTIQTTPLPSGATDATLSAVSCSAASS